MIRMTYVTITYNAADVLQRTLDSVLSQDYPEIVHLIIDGASTDATLQLVNAYIQQSNAAENGHRIQVTSEPDNGIYDAMNKGLRSLDGDYVCFLNAGDFLPASDTVSRIVEKIDQSQLPAVLYGDTDIVDGDIPLLNLKMVVANYTEEGQTTRHHRESLWERYHVMERHYGRVQTFLLHVWFAIRSLLITNFLLLIM